MTFRIKRMRLRPNPVRKRKRKAKRAARRPTRVKLHYLAEIITDRKGLRFSYIGPHGKRVHHMRSAEKFSTHANAIKHGRDWINTHKLKGLRGVRIVANG
jgi:hypothetical protein